MPRQCSKPFDREQLDLELQAMIRKDREAVSHALVCPVCESRGTALHALALAGWTEADWWYLEENPRG